MRFSSKNQFRLPIRHPRVSAALSYLCSLYGPVGERGQTPWDGICMKFLPPSSKSPLGLIKLWEGKILSVGRVERDLIEFSGILGRIAFRLCGQESGYDSIPDSHRTIYSYNLNKILI